MLVDGDSRDFYCSEPYAGVRTSDGQLVPQSTLRYIVLLQAVPANLAPVLASQTPVTGTAATTPAPAPATAAVPAPAPLSLTVRPQLPSAHC